MPPVEIIVALALLQFVYFILRVGAARGKYGVPAPATTGHEIFERYFRVQMNTLEMLVVFVPSIVLFGKYISPLWAAGLGAVYLVGRFIYLRAYVADPKSRSVGFGLSFLPTAIMLLGGLGGAVYHCFAAPAL
jgi:glutathione S-transferase